MDPTTDEMDRLKSRPIKATWFRRNATLCAISLLKRFRKRFSDVLFLTSGLCVKYSEDASLAEAATMEYVRTRTSIPVAKVHCSFEHADKTYVLMQRLPGQNLLMAGQNFRKKLKLRCLLS